jgi:hypothetical protein
MQAVIETTYTYEQLDDNAKEKVKAWWYEHGLWDRWYEDTYEQYKEEGYELGFLIGKMYFSGFYSQGDGASWSGQIDIVAWLRAHTEDSIAREAWIQLINEGWAEKHMPVGQDGRYCHSGTMSVAYWDGMIGDPESIQDLEPSHQLMQQESIFKGMNALDLLNLITSSDFDLKSMADIADALKESAKDYADKLYKQLREEYEYLTSEENLIESCDANDWKFNNEGEMV